MSETNRTDIAANHLWHNTFMLCRLLLLGILLIIQPTYADQNNEQTDWQVVPALPPLVKEGEAVKDLLKWMIDQRTGDSALALSPDGRIFATAKNRKRQCSKGGAVRSIGFTKPVALSSG